jgi:hypothetical protein
MKIKKDAIQIHELKQLWHLSALVKWLGTFSGDLHKTPKRALFHIFMLTG